MHKKFVFAAMLAIVIGVVAISAQDKRADFSGTWKLDTAASALGGRAAIESQTMTVKQTENEIKIETQTKRAAPPSDGGGRAGGGRMGGDPDVPSVYSLDGKEKKSEVDGMMGKTVYTTKASFDGAKLILSSTRAMTSQMGEFTIPTTETWELSGDGKKLTVKREMTTPRGSNNSNLVFTK
jgi:hypothetical protein